MAVEDHGLEVLKKSGEQVNPGEKSDYYIKVGPTVGGASGSFPVSGELELGQDTLDFFESEFDEILSEAQSFHNDLIHEIDEPVADDDRGVLVLGKASINFKKQNISDGNAAVLSLSDYGEARTRDQRALDLHDCNDLIDTTVINDDTDNMVVTAKHVFGTGAIQFDKVNGAGNSVFAGVQKTFSPVNVDELFEAGGFVGLMVYIPTLTQVANVFIRIGTDANNYNAWVWSPDSLTAARWLNLRASTASPSYDRSVGNGWDTNAIQYVAFGVEFQNFNNTLSGIVFDQVHLVEGRVTSTDINASITSDVASPNINLHRVGGTPTDVNAGNSTAGTQRVVLASDQPDVDVVDKSHVTGSQPVVSGTANTTPTAYPTVAGGVIRSFLITSGTGLVAGNVQISFDGGTSYFTLANGGTVSGPVAGNRTQVHIKTASGTNSFQLILTRD